MLFHLLAKGGSNAHSACLRFLLGLALLFMSTSGWTQSQEWAYSLGQEALSEPIILTDPSLGTDRLLAANLQYPSGVQDILLTRQDELGAIVWQTRVDIGAKDQIGAMELIPVGPLAGELILVGETDYLSSASAFLCRLDPNATGGPVVVETFIDPFPGGGGSTNEGRYLDLTIREEGGALRIACAGWMGASGPGASRSAVVSEFEIGATGFVRLWSRKLDTTPQVDDHDMASTIVHIPGDGYLIGGTLNGTTGFTLPCGAVHRLNYAGGTEWTSRLMGNAGTIAVADLAFLGQNGQVVALSNHTATEAFGIHVLSYADGLLQQAQVFDPNGPHAGLALAGFAMETIDPMGQFLVAGMAKDHIDPDHAGDQNPPFHMLIDVNENGILAGGDLILHEEFATDLGETVSGFSWFGNGTQPFIHHPDMVALGGGNDLVLAAGRSQFLPLSADLDVVPSNWAGDDGTSCETLSLILETIPSDAILEGGSMEGAFDGPLTPTSGITLSAALTPLDCDEITVPPCNLPSLILTSMDLDVVTAAAALAATPDAEILFSWDFGDGSAPVAGLGLSSVTHEYDVAGEYTITLTSSCAWDASTTTSIQTTVSFGSEYCIEVEEVILDNDLIPELVPEGLSTYRYYVTCENPGDRVVSLTTPAGSGIFTSTEFFQANASYVLGSDINPLVYAAGFPDTRYDSWLTIGLDRVPNSALGEGPVSYLASPSDTWYLNFEEGGAVEMVDDIGGGLYTIVGDANQLCGADQRVLLAQLTTDGSITGDIDVQIIPEGTTQVSLDGSTFDILGLDLTGDGLGNIADLMQFLAYYGAEASGYTAAADINGNGVLDWDDLTKVLAPNSLHVELELDPPCEASSFVETCYPFFPTDLDFNFSMACDPQWALVRFPDELYDLSEYQLDCYVQIRGGLGETDNIRINLDPSSVSLSDFAGFFRGRIIPLDWPRISDGSPTTWDYTAELKFYQEGAYEEGLDPCHVIEKTDYCSSGVGPLWYARELLPSLSVDLSACAASASPLPPFLESRGLTYRIDGLPDGVSEAQFMSAFEAGEDLSPYGAPLDSVELQPGITPLDCGGYGYEMVTSFPVFTAVASANGIEYTEVATGEVFSASEFEAVPRAIAIEDPRIQLQALLVQPPTGSNDLTPAGPFGPFSALPGFGDDCADLTEVSLGGQAIVVNPLLYAGGVNDWGDVSVTPDVGHNGITLLDSLVYDDQGLLTLGQLAPGETLSLINTGETNECPSEPVALATFSASIGSPSSVGGTNGIEGPCPPGYDCQGIGLTASTVVSHEDMGSDDYDVNDVVVQLQLDGAANAGPLSWSITNVENEVVATGQTAAGDSGGPLTLTLPGGSYTLDVDASCGAYTPQLSLSSGTAMQYGIPTQLLPVSLAPTIGPASFSFTLPGGLGIPLGSSWSATGCNAAFDHSSMPFGTYTPPPGTVIGQEDNIKLSMEVFNDGSGNIYNFGFIAMAPTGPLSGKAFHTSNVNAVYDLSAFPNVTEVSFDFYDGAGVENLRVNGATWLIDEFELMAPGVASGVTMSVTTQNFAGYQTGTVTLTGNVQELWVGGQQFSVDNLCVKHDGTIVTATGPACPDQCEGGSDFDALPFGEKYGDLPSGATTFVAIGDVAFDADGIPVSLYELTSSSGFLGYQYAHVDGPQAAYGFGGGNTLELRNVTASFDIASVYPETDTLCLHFLDEGGYENLSINGSTLTITANGKGGLAALDGTSLGGVDIAVSGTPFTTGSGTPVAYAGILSLIGDVDELVIGGQEFWIDSLCIGIPGPPDSATLAEVLDNGGEEGLLDLLSLAVDLDTASCQMAVAIQLDPGFPAVDSIGIQLVGAETGTVYSEGPQVFAVTESGEFHQGLIATMVPIPDVGNAQLLSLSLSFSDLNTAVLVDAPDIVVPGCVQGGTDYPCDVDATFLTLQTNCVLAFSAPAGGGGSGTFIETWTLNGNPVAIAGDLTSFSLELEQDVPHTLCRTLTSINDPNCTDTYCTTVTPFCEEEAADEAANPCHAQFEHESDIMDPTAGGTIAPDFTAVDTEGVEHNLYDLLNQDKKVILSFFSTWCNACLNYHNTGALEDIWQSYGPSGTDEVYVFHIEADNTTTSDDLNGTGSATVEDWSSAISAPIIDDGFGIADDYAISYFPTIITICPDGSHSESGQISAEAHTTILFDAACASGTELLSGAVATENGIELTIKDYEAADGTLTSGTGTFTLPPASFGANRVLALNGAGAEYDLSGVGAGWSELTLEFMDQGGPIQIILDSETHEINIAGIAPYSYFDVFEFGGYTVELVAWEYGNFPYRYGILNVKGTPNNIGMAGQLLWLDNLCLESCMWHQAGQTIVGDGQETGLGAMISLSSDGQRMAVSGYDNPALPETTTNNYAGLVRVYEWSDAAAQWLQIGGDITGEFTAAFAFKISLSDDGQRLAVGAPGFPFVTENSYPGSVRVYEWDAAAENWVQLGEALLGDLPEEQFGHSVSLSGDGTRLCAGAPTGIGRIQVFDWNEATGLWEQVGQDLLGEPSLHLNMGRVVNLSADGLRLANQHTGYDAAGTYVTNHVSVYEWDAGSGQWTPMGDELVGNAWETPTRPVLSEDGLRLAVGFSSSPGYDARAEVYEWNPASGSWNLLGQMIDLGGTGDFTSTAVDLSLDGSILAYSESSHDDRKGRAGMYAWDGATGQWVPMGQELMGTSKGDRFGSGISLAGDGTRMAFGATGEDLNGSSSGTVRAFDWCAAPEAAETISDLILEGDVIADYFDLNGALLDNSCWLAVSLTLPDFALNGASQAVLVDAQGQPVPLLEPIDGSGNYDIDISGLNAGETIQLMVSDDQGSFTVPGITLTVPECGSGAPFCPSDIDGNGATNTQDLLVLLANFGLDCE